MNNKRPAAPPPPPLISPRDIYHVLFRHKWKIIIISALGIATSVGVWFGWKVPNQSEARLFIQSVRDSKSPSLVQGLDSRPKDDEGVSLINTELAILTSLDVAHEVATNYYGGPAKILEKAGGGNDDWAAAGVIMNGLGTRPLPKSSVVRITFEHPDRGVAQGVLEEVIKTYLKKHAEIHGQQSAFRDFYTKQIEALKYKLRETEGKLSNAKTNKVFMSLAESKKEISDQIIRVRQSLWDTQAELAGREATKRELEANLLQLKPERASLGTNQPTGTNNLGEVKAVALSPAIKTEYRRLRGRLEKSYEKETQLLAIYTPENKQVKILQDQIAADEERKQQLEEENPGLVAVKVAENSGALVSADPTLNLRMALSGEQVKIISLTAKITTLLQQMKDLQEQADDLSGREDTITELERTRKLLEQQYTYFDQNVAQARIDKDLMDAKVSNISVVQAPSPAGRDTLKLRKVCIMILFGSIGFSFFLAFVTEFFLDPTLKRPIDIENKLGLPLFLSIPKLSLNGAGAHLNGKKPAGLLTQGLAKEAASSQEGKVGVPAIRTEIPPWDPHHTLRPFVEALRDRLITYFEVKNLTHKPKLVAVTSCGEGAGVSTVAAGLAASLSETGDGNVLLVDMNQEHGATHQFYKGDLALDDALELEKREDAMVSENLYVVSETSKNDKLPSALPKRFKNLVPRLRASDYDYIIFDMPPVTQISITPRLARFMDSVLMVVEAEQTDKDVVKRATDVLLEAEANVGVVMNKWRTYVPKRLAQDL